MKGKEQKRGEIIPRRGQGLSLDMTPWTVLGLLRTPGAKCNGSLYCGKTGPSPCLGPLPAWVPTIIAECPDSSDITSESVPFSFLLPLQAILTR